MDSIFYFILGGVIGIALSDVVENWFGRGLITDSPVHPTREG